MIDVEKSSLEAKFYPVIARLAEEELDQELAVAVAEVTEQFPLEQPKEESIIYDFNAILDAIAAA